MSETFNAAQNFERLGITAILFLMLAFSWIYVFPKMWIRMWQIMSERDVLLKEANSTIANVTDALKEQDEKSTAAVLNELRHCNDRLGTKLDVMSRDINGLQGHISGVFETISQAQKRK